MFSEPLTRPSATLSPEERAELHYEARNSPRGEGRNSRLNTALSLGALGERVAEGRVRGHGRSV
jgi:hypothetical protein